MFRISLVISLVPFETNEKNHQIDNEQQHDGRFQQEHPAVGLIVIQELIQVIESLQFTCDSAMPITEMEAGGDILVDAGEVPIAEELGDIREFIVESRQIDPNFT